LLAEAVVPVAAIEGAVEGYSALGRLAVKGGTEVVKEAAKVGSEQGAKATGVFSVAGTEMEPGGVSGGAERAAVSPEALQSKTWQAISDLSTSLAELTPVGQGQLLLMSNTEYAIGELRVHLAGGEVEMSDEELIDLVRTLKQADAAVQPLGAELSKRRESLTRLEAQILAVPDYSVSEIEKDIWVLWMATIPDSESKILDRDPIEDHLTEIHVLGPGSLLGVDFGWWTFESDCLAALAAARPKAVQIREKYSRLTSIS
jgi:hypothetical protein